jgi:uncharacterized membrane protein
MALRWLQASYLALIALQPGWHALWPGGAHSWVLAAVCATPLLLPLRGVLMGSLRSITWGGYLVMLYLLIGVTEAWSSPPQRIPALAQSLLVVAYVAAALAFSRRETPPSTK